MPDTHFLEALCVIQEAIWEQFENILWYLNHKNSNGLLFNF